MQTNVRNVQWNLREDGEFYAERNPARTPTKKETQTQSGTLCAVEREAAMGGLLHQRRFHRDTPDCFFLVFLLPPEIKSCFK